MILTQTSTVGEGIDHESEILQPAMVAHLWRELPLGARGALR
jgi:hypothetical protein